MDSYFNFEAFDITPLISQYQGKRIEEIFVNHQIIENSQGKFMEIQWHEENYPCSLNLEISKRKLLQNLKTVYYIGENIERELIKKGVKSLYDLKINLRYKDSAKEILNLINKQEYQMLCSNRYINDLDVIFCFDLEELLFVDIETLGLYDSPIIIIGLGYYKNNKFQIRILFARNLEEEIALCQYLKAQVLPKFRCFISYNGKSFDIPFIASRFLYFFEENPMISDTESPYRISNTKFHHIDLYHNCRRKFKGMYERYTLTNMEEKLLGLVRENELPSSLVGFCYRKYLDDPIRHVGLVKEIIEHNYWDIYSMPLILAKLMED